MKKRSTKRCPILLMGIGLLALTGCPDSLLSLFTGGFEDATPLLPPGSSASSEIVNIDNLTEGAIGFIDLDGQNILYLFGTKTLDGEVSSVDAVVLANTATGALYQYILDDRGRPIQLIEGDVTIDLSYSADDQFVTVTRGLSSVTIPVPTQFSDLLSAVENGSYAKKTNAKSMSFGQIAAGVLAPLGFAAAVILGTYTSGIWVGITMVGATAAAITGAYHAAQAAGSAPSSPHDQQIINTVDAIGTFTSIASIGKNTAIIINAASNSDKVMPVLSVLNDTNSVHESVEQGVQIAMTTLTKGSFTVGISPPDPAPYQPVTVTVRISPAQLGVRIDYDVAGTDGFSFSETQLTGSSGTISFSIPGGAAGVKDIINVSSGGETRTFTYAF